MVAKMSMGTIINQGLNQKRMNSMIAASAAVSAPAPAPAPAANKNVFAYGTTMINRVHTAKPGGCGACGK